MQTKTREPRRTTRSRKPYTGNSSRSFPAPSVGHQRRSLPHACGDGTVSAQDLKVRRRRHILCCIGGAYLATEETLLLTLFTGTPELKVVLSRVVDAQLALLPRQRREVDMDDDSGVLRTRVVSHEDEPATRVRRHGDDRLHAHWLV